MHSNLWVVLCAILIIYSGSNASASIVNIGGVDYTFTEIDAPGSNSTTGLGGINDLGQIVSDYFDSSAGQYIGLEW